MYRSEPNQSCVIVSNGQHPKPRGEWVDAFDHVVRLNGAPTAGWEKYVGRITTIWSRWEPVPDDDRFGPDVRKLAWNHGGVRNLKPGEEQVPDLPTKIAYQEQGCSPAPTTGLATLLFLLGEFHTIHLLNWYTGKYGFSRHYWEGAEEPKELKEVLCPSHSAKREARYVKRLQEAGRVVLINDCDP